LISASSSAFGVYLGSTVHEVGQVVAAGRSINVQVADVAVITKMVRVMMLAPFLIGLPFFLPKKLAVERNRGASPVVMPWFALMFIVMVVLNSSQILSDRIVSILVNADTLMLATAMAGLGLTTHLSAVRSAGKKPLMLAMVLLVWLVIAGAGINRLVFWL
jgi:uncharacterized integral membrane protein (TIGR00698 family)